MKRGPIIANLVFEREGAHEFRDDYVRHDVVKTMADALRRCIMALPKDSSIRGDAYRAIKFYERRTEE